MAQKILITGSSGFIGRNLKQVLLRKGHEVVDFNSAQGDIAAAPLKFSNIDYVFHLAGKSFVPDSWKNPEEFMRVNVEGTKNVLRFCHENKIPLLFMSSYIYGIPEKLPVNELDDINPSNPYMRSKYEAEKLCALYALRYKMKISIVRPFNIYGIGQPEYFLVSKIIKQVLDKSQEKVTLMDLSPRRDYVYMDDLMDAMLLLYEKKIMGSFNVGSGYSLSVKEIAEIILKEAGVKKEIMASGEVRPNEIPDVVADISKIKTEVGWVPKTSFQEGIRKILAAEKN
jgi:nucleoside-diphosphate-sugar epimerase